MALGVDRGAEQGRHGEGRVGPEIGFVKRRAGELLEGEGLDRAALGAVRAPKEETGEGESEVSGFAAVAEVRPAFVRRRGPVVGVGGRDERVAADEPGAGRGEEWRAGEPGEL